MNKFLISMFSNRFGILLSVSNLLYFLIKTPLIQEFPRPLITKVFLAANAPALIASRMFEEIVFHFIPAVPLAAKYELVVVNVSVFIVLQWLLIAWAANKLAAKIRPQMP